MRGGLDDRGQKDAEFLSVKLAPNAAVAIFKTSIANFFAEGCDPLSGMEVVAFVNIDANSFVVNC